MSETEAIVTARQAFGAGGGGGTSVVTAADGEGNRVVVVHSNSFPQYGSGVVVSEYDLVLNNRPGRGFALDAPSGHWNAPGPLSIPATTLNAWHMGSDTAEFWGGTPGGENQAVWNLQTVTALLSGAEPLDAILRPKRSEEHTSELQSLMRISYAVFCLTKTKNKTQHLTQLTSSQPYKDMT